MKVLIITYRPNTEQLCSDLVIRTVEESELVDKLVSIITNNYNVALVNVVCKKLEDYHFGSVGQRFAPGIGSVSIYTAGMEGGNQLRADVDAKIETNKRQTTLNKIRAEIEKDVKEKYERKLHNLLKKFNEEQE